MTLALSSLGHALGTQATGVDLSRPVSDADRDALVAAFDSTSVLCVREQCLSPEQLLTVARWFGEPEEQVNKHLRLPDFPQVGVLSSETKDLHGTGKRVIQGTTWHTDHSFTARPPKATMLYALEIPATGGNTSFSNMRAAYEALDADRKQRIDALQAVHSYESRRSPRKMLVRTQSEKKETPDVTHPLVRWHEPTRSGALYLSTTRLDRIVGLSDAESDSLVDELLAHATQDRFVYHHEWRVGDLLVWDNRCLMHHANADYPLDATRRMHRILVEGEIPVGLPDQPGSGERTAA